MKTNHKISLVVGLVLVGSALAEEKKIKRSELPTGVEKTVAEQGKRTTIRAFGRAQENGQTRYKAEMFVNGQWIRMAVRGSCSRNISVGRDKGSA